MLSFQGFRIDIFNHHVAIANYVNRRNVEMDVTLLNIIANFQLFWLYQRSAFLQPYISLLSFLMIQHCHETKPLLSVWNLTSIIRLNPTPGSRGIPPESLSPWQGEVSHLC